MNEKLAKKLKKILAKAGLEEDKIGEIVEEVEGAIAEEVTDEDGNPAEPPLPPSEENGDVVPPIEEGAGDVPPQGDLPIPPTEEVVPPTEGDVPPEVPPQEGDGSIEAALSQLAQQEGQPTLPPQEGDVPPAPIAPIEDPRIGELESQLGEANKTIEALSARVDSLLEALKEAGVISGSSALGDETPRVTPNANHNEEDAFDDILATINGK